MASISIPEINEKVRGYFQGCLNQGEEYVQEFPDDPTINVSDEADYSFKKAKQMQSDLAKANFPSKVKQVAQGMMPSPANGDKSFDPEAFLYACRTVMRAEIEASRILGAKLSGDYASVAPKDGLFEGMAATDLPPLPGEKPAVLPSTMSFREVADMYLAQRTPVWALKSVQATTYALKVAAELYGPDKALSLYAAADKKLFRDTFAKLPPHHDKLPQFANMSLIQSAAANKSGPFLSFATQKKNLGFLTTFLTWAMNEEYLEKLPGSGVKVLSAKSNELAPRESPHS